MKQLEELNNKLKQKVSTFKAAIILGFFIGFGIISNIIPPEAGSDIGKAGFLLIIIIGFTFWGIGYNIATMSISNLITWILKDFLKIRINKEKLFILLTLSCSPLALGTITGITRMIDKSLDIGVYTLIALAILVFITLYLNIGGLKKMAIKEPEKN
ncbi:hypothetical protein [Pontibacter virosus]|uniref:Uncharacterized protein n=1 Tax=Pontibacter virosus TaxID=1765052 RepID=A0A2U1AUZ4_9BACT|nr:hypothetical protein [Pontibacter virosus]PVY40259.1 hypothetical protein C8E01_108153 [Pontibacter virosus]